MSAEETAEAVESLAAKAAEKLLAFVGTFESAVVAYSGGVDSAVVAAAAAKALGERAIAVTAESPSVAAAALEGARRTAGEIGIRHRVVRTREVERADYRANDGRRCFWCKQTLYETLQHVAREHAAAVILSGTNLDDLGDHRPGIEAGREAGVVTPLADCGIDKETVRAIAQWWKLSVWDLPAAPCLASRVAYGVEVTAERLHSIEQAEQWLREHGCRELRVRLHEGPIARIEVPLEEVPRLTSPPIWPEIHAAFQRFGFRYVTLDLGGLRSGNLNDLIQIAPPTASVGHGS
ncbi:ATP-dependent sacrificial sulfur transferase LarE [Candidatus Laterigemmans baculatus]|uniref:ATP-dependent sacrificial sulfur transferase LarE n=1 Tax=Candidatus Laterigemmans baculatus TaxID=2770505 RepID=UPI0013DD8609|nr:ATP-dependent sacrificial sulfur transferase LarE [Candidatus Laterigemmans baculatus]